jgi:hypothetical protein
MMGGLMGDGVIGPSRTSPLLIALLAAVCQRTVMKCPLLQIVDRVAAGLFHCGSRCVHRAFRFGIAIVDVPK